MRGRVKSYRWTVTFHDLHHLFMARVDVEKVKDKEGKTQYHCNVESMRLPDDMAGKYIYFFEKEVNELIAKVAGCVHGILE